jgi:hypothetical protein
MLDADILYVSKPLETTNNNDIFNLFSWVFDDPHAKVIGWEPMY